MTARARNRKTGAELRARARQPRSNPSVASGSDPPGGATGLLGWTWALPGRFVRSFSSLKSQPLAAATLDGLIAGARRRCPAFSVVSSPRRRARTVVAPPPCVLLPFFKSNYPTASLPFSNGDLGKFFFDGR
ncbi:hypothetical protein PVAP13_2KG088016 [Panicum virgatum]|uniref:Uncharacterized protein n=1 Tax=Panicum virgatum TaxID=38727 RepID=A0A8T0W6S4_PANVG|nr:hypothetical protein PVAP13_2KG088016 [Panicum virgatum]